MNIWKELGISKTNDVREIKKAYAKRSKLVHPEEHPEEFQQLHRAYREALRLAKSRNPLPVMDSEDTSKPYADTQNKASANEHGENIHLHENKHDSADELDFNAARKKDETDEIGFEEDFAKEQTEPEEVFDFQASFEKNTLRHNNTIMEKTEPIIKKANELYYSKASDSEKDWLAIFTDPAVREIQTEPIFLKELCRFLTTHKIYENISGAIYKAFHLGSIDLESAGELEELYRLISRAKAQAYIRLANKVKLVLMVAGFLTVASILLILAGQYFISLVLAVPAIVLFIRHDKLKKRKESFYD